MAVRSLLIVGDSNQKFIHENVLYSELSVDKVVTGSVDPKNRGYCSERSWINAIFPEKNLEEQVPKLLFFLEKKKLQSYRATELQASIFFPRKLS